MANVKWNDLFAGDFFTVNLSTEQDTLLYQKIKETDKGYNAVLLNKGELCCIAANTFTTLEEVRVTFSIKPTN
jgi:hypothetical protein